MSWEHGDGLPPPLRRRSAAPRAARGRCLRALQRGGDHPPCVGASRRRSTDTDGRSVADVPSIAHKLTTLRVSAWSNPDVTIETDERSPKVNKVPLPNNLVSPLSASSFVRPAANQPPPLPIGRPGLESYRWLWLTPRSALSRSDPARAQEPGGNVPLSCLRRVASTPRRLCEL